MWSVNYGNNNALYSNWTILLVVIQSSKIKTAKVNGFAMIFEKIQIYNEDGKLFNNS